MRRRVRRSAKKSFHVRALAAGAVGDAAEGAVEALRVRGLAWPKRCGVKKKRGCDCRASARARARVLVENWARAGEELGPRIAGGWRLAKARAGQRALRASMACVCVFVGEGEVGKLRLLNSPSCTKLPKLWAWRLRWACCMSASRDATVHVNCKDELSVLLR